MRHKPFIPALFAFLWMMPLSASAQTPVDVQSDTWLGVQLAPVPAALAAHLQIEDTGLMVRNIFKDSPADQAGLQQYDVILEADGKKVADDVRSFSEHIRSKAAGQTLNLSIYRQAKPLSLTVHLARQPDDGRMELKYPDDPDVIHRKNFGMRGKILRPGPNGWVVEDLGELPDADWLPGGRDVPPRGEMNEAKRVDKNHQVLHVRRLKDGKIEVRRYGMNEQPTEKDIKTYANMQELFNADPEAADLLSTAEKNDSRSTREPRGPRWQEWRDRFFQGPLSEPRPGPRSPQPPEPNIKFEVQPNGEIRVKARQQDAELETTFKSREDFKTRAPELYKRFEAVEKDLR